LFEALVVRTNPVHLSP